MTSIEMGVIIATLYFRSIPSSRIINKKENMTMRTSDISKIKDSTNKLSIIDFCKDMTFSIHKITKTLIMTAIVNVAILNMTEIAKYFNLYSFFIIFHLKANLLYFIKLSQF